MPVRKEGWAQKEGEAEARDKKRPKKNPDARRERSHRSFCQECEMTGIREN